MAKTKEEALDLAPETEEIPEVEDEKKVTIMLPYDANEGDVFVSVNARTWLIQRGVQVEVPKCVAEVLQAREDGLRKAYEAAHQHVSD